MPEREGDYLDHLRPLVLLPLNTALRRGERLGLRWGAVDLDAKILTVLAETAKSGHTRRIPLNAEASEVLSAWYKRHGKPGSSAFVFPQRRAHDADRHRLGVAHEESSPQEFLTARLPAPLGRQTRAGRRGPLHRERVAGAQRDRNARALRAHLAPNNLSAAVEKVASESHNVVSAYPRKS